MVKSPDQPAKTGPVKIADVARSAGVSAMTVSRVMNHSAGVKPETRDAVLAVVERLGYAPNAAARSLARSGAGRLGLLYSNPSAGYLSEFLIGALEEVSRSGAQLQIEKCDSDPDSERDAISRLAAGGVGGVILPPPHGESLAALDAIKTQGLVAIAVAAGGPVPEAVTVGVDDRAAAAEMTRYLLGLGHRRIGFIKGATDQRASSERLTGFEAEMHAADPSAEALVEDGDFTYRSGMEAAERLLSLDKPPTAIFASNDDMAMAVIAAAHRRGLDVPRQLSVVGFDDTPLATAVWPALTTIRQPIAEMAAVAIGLLVRALANGAHPSPLPAEHRIAHALIVRDSCARSPT
jgi:LacI family transcriptional regulator